MISIEAEDIAELQAVLEQDIGHDGEVLEWCGFHLASGDTLWSVETSHPKVRAMCDEHKIPYVVLSD